MTDVAAFRSDAPWRHQFDVARDPYAARNAMGIDTVLVNYLTTAGAATTYATAANFPATAWTAWTPTMSASSGTITSTTINRARYAKAGKTITALIDVTITNAGTGAGAFVFTLPVTAATAGSGAFFGRETVNSGIVLGGNTLSTTTGAVFAYTGGTTIATNARVFGIIIYEAA